MSGSTVVHAAAALVVGAGAGAGFLFVSGDLAGSGKIAQLADDKASVERRLQKHADASAVLAKAWTEYDAEVAKRKAAEEARAKAEAEAKAAAEAEAAAAAAAATAKPAAAPPKPVEVLPAFGLLTLKGASGDLEVDGGPGLAGRGKSVDLSFTAAPGRIKVRSGPFKVDLTPRVEGKGLKVDVSVSPLAIITADGNRVGTSAQGLVIDRKPFKLDFASPNAGELNLLLVYRK